VVRSLATVGTLASRLADAPADDRHTLELLGATPRSGVRPDTWLADLRCLGEAMAHLSIVNIQNSAYAALLSSRE
jgi:hypothetical protein